MDYGIEAGDRLQAVFTAVLVLSPAAYQDFGAALGTLVRLGRWDEAALLWTDFVEIQHYTPVINGHIGHAGLPACRVAPCIDMDFARCRDDSTDLTLPHDGSDWPDLTSGRTRDEGEPPLSGCPIPLCGGPRALQRPVVQWRTFRTETDADCAYLFVEHEAAGEEVVAAWQTVRPRMGYMQDLGLIHQRTSNKRCKRAGAWAMPGGLAHRCRSLALPPHPEREAAQAHRVRAACVLPKVEAEEPELRILLRNPLRVPYNGWDCKQPWLDAYQTIRRTNADNVARSPTSMAAPMELGPLQLNALGLEEPAPSCREQLSFDVKLLVSVALSEVQSCGS